MKLGDLRAGLKSRRWTGGLRRGRVLLVAAGAAIVVAALSWLLFFSSVLAVRTVEVQGTDVLTIEEVLRQADAPIGLPLARLRERPIAERVAQLLAVDEVTVRRRLPDKLEILVTERVPVFGVGEGERITLVDAAGVGFPGPRGEGLPLGEGPLGDPALLAGVAGVVTSLPPDLRAHAERVRFASSEAITVRLSDGTEILYGSAKQPQLKGEVALALVRGTGAKHIDVSAPTRPSTR